MLAKSKLSLSEPSELNSVSSKEVGSSGWSALVVLITLNQETSVLLAGSGQSSEFSVLVNGITDPVDSWVVLDGSVVRIDEDDLEELEGGVFGNPVA